MDLVLNTATGLVFCLRNTGIAYACTVTQATDQPALDACQALSAFYSF